MSESIDAQGFRLNVGMIVSNDKGEVLLARKNKTFCWQFPQGGIGIEETEEEALFRELKEEIGLDPDHIDIINKSRDWHSYRLPNKFLRPHVLGQTKCIGQKQKWFLLRMIGEESDICLGDDEQAEFSEWGWFEPGFSVQQAIYFKKKLYAGVLKEFLLQS